MKQRITEWMELDPQSLEYHQKQFKEPYRSTVKFCDWLEIQGCITPQARLNILDIGAGAGANIYYMNERFPNAKFWGIDINDQLVNLGNYHMENTQKENCKLEVGNLYDLDTKYKNAMDGIISIQTLSWLPDYKTALEKMMDVQPSWIALTSLFFDGKVNCHIEIEDYTIKIDGQSCRDSFYNVYSLDLVRSLFEEHGYEDFRYVPFEIDIDLSKPNTKGMGTYTEKLDDGRRIQLSGPILMPWYFVLAQKKK